MKVSEIQTRGIVHIPMSCNLQQAAAQMRDQHVGALIVTADDSMNQMAGILTDRDIAVHAVASGMAPNEMLVADVMTPYVATVDANADLDDAMQAMSSNGVRRLAVTDADEDIVGLLSLDDVIDALGRQMMLLASIVCSEQSRESKGLEPSPLHR